MGMKVLAGTKFNLLERAAAAATVSDEDAGFLRGGLIDRRPGSPFRFGSAASDRLITYDLNEVVNPGFEGWVSGLPPGWLKVEAGGGTVTEGTGSDARSGSGLKCTRGSQGAVAQGYQDILAFPGEVRTLDGWYKNLAGGTNPKAVARILNLHTGKYLRGSDVSWQTSLEEVGSTIGTTYVNLSNKVFTVEAYSICRRTTVTLRLILETQADSGGAACFDDWVCWSSWDFASLHGHNLDPSIVVTFRSSTDNFSGNDTVEATPTVQLGSFYAALSASVNKRYFRARFGGTNLAGGAIYVGELVVGKALTLAQPPDWPFGKTWVAPQVRGRVGNWGSYALGLGGHPPRSFRLSFRQDAAAFSEWFERVFLASADGSPIVAVPDDGQADVLYCRPPEVHVASRVNLTHHDVTEITLEELPFPMLVG